LRILPKNYLEQPAIMAPKRKPRCKRDAEAASDNPNGDKKRSKVTEDAAEESIDASPVVVKKLEHAFPKPIGLNPSLEDLFGGSISADDFLKTIFRKKALYVDHGKTDPRARIGVLQEEMCRMNVRKILSETSSDNIFLWLCGGKDEKRNGLIRSIEVEDVDKAMTLYEVGHATYCRAPPRVEQNLVASLLKVTGMGCGQYDPSAESTICLGRGEVETFISTPGHVTDWHFDFQENFTIQLSGSKKWTLMEGTIADPLRACTPHYNSPESVESQLKAAYLIDKKFVFGKPNPPINAKGTEISIVMKPGDVLYFPAGMWHAVETIVPGVSINVSLMATNYAHTISHAVYHYLCRDARFRQPIINNSVMSAPNQLQELMKDLPDIIRQLSKSNGEGAHDILPPKLQFPPHFQIMGEEETVTTSGEISESEGEDMNGGEVRDVDDVPTAEEKESDAPIDKNAGDEDDHLETTSPPQFEDTLDPATFIDYPDGWVFSLEIGKRIKLYKNPLSALHKLEEITSFYDRSNRKHHHRNSGVFVLNVNFGGDMGHESAIRVQFRDNEEGMTQRLWDLERKLSSDCENHLLDECAVTEGNHYLISFLVYHGYVQIK
jgi:hypothetical protein